MALGAGLLSLSAGERPEGSFDPSPPSSLEVAFLARPSLITHINLTSASYTPSLPNSAQSPPWHPLPSIHEITYSFCFSLISLLTIDYKLPKGRALGFLCPWCPPSTAQSPTQSRCCRKMCWMHDFRAVPLHAAVLCKCSSLVAWLIEKVCQITANPFPSLLQVSLDRQPRLGDSDFFRVSLVETVRPSSLG